MIRHSFILGLLVLGACFESHGASDNVVRNTDCYTCHQPQYEAAGVATKPQIYLGSPFHNTNDAKTACSKDCVQCHSTQDWSNFMGGCVHPEGMAGVPGGFALVSQGTLHTNLKCLDCHSEAISVALNVTAKAGANTDCIACHPNNTAMANNHVGVTYDTGAKAGQAYAYSSTDHRFCLDCHPKGLGIGHGPTNPFILPHRGATCAQCHDSASGLGHRNGADVLCVTSGCHDGSGNSDRAHHSDTNHHPGCLAAGCHPDGRKHGG